MPRLAYPPTRTVDQTDDYHGTLVPDPYRWLEDVDAPETRAWVDAQNALTLDFLEQIPARGRLRQRLTELWDYPRRQPPLRRGGRYFQLRNTGLQNQDVLYVSDSLDGEARVLLDPNSLSPDGTVALNAWEASQDGKWLAFAISSGGSDWQTWCVRSVDTGDDLPEQVEWSKFSGAAWLPDGSGFYYARYTAPEPGAAYSGANYNQQLFFHRRGTSQAEDVLIYARPDQPEWGFGAEVTDDGHYLVLNVWQGTDTRNRVFYQDLRAGGPMIELVSELKAGYSFVGNDGQLFYFRTDLNAPRGRLVAVDVSPDAGGPRPGDGGSSGRGVPTGRRYRWRTLIPESDDVLDTVKIVFHQFVAVYLHHAHHVLRRHALDGRFLGDVALPGLGALTGPAGISLTGSAHDTEMFYLFHSFVHPASVYRFDFRTGRGERLFSPPVDFDFEPYVTRQVFVPSRDGTRVPMFLVHRADLAPDGRSPTLLYGYGGFNLSLTPAFSAARLAWLELGGVYAQANLRGGGEYGEAWHQAGSLGRKQNVFDDFTACAEWLIAERITCAPRLAIEGRSNGGLLVGACLAQRPELFGAALAHVGVMDMLRFHKFTIGWAWVSDYGSADDPRQYPALYAYSPLHNLRPGTAYPAVLITTGDHDDRVVPGHSFKFAAALQAAQGGPAPVLIRIQTRAGHGFGKPTALLIQEQADIYAFAWQALGMV